MALAFMLLFATGFMAPVLENFYPIVLDLFGNVLALALPLVAITSGLLALKRIEESGGGLVGAPLAKVGITLGMLWLGLCFVSSLWLILK